MQIGSVHVLARSGRAVAVAAGLMALLVLEPEPPQLAQAASALVVPGGPPQSPLRALILSDQARRYLALQYRSYPTEFMGCMIGEIRGQTALVRRIGPADVEPSHSTSTHVSPRQTCEDAGWAGTVGVIHSHPNGERCWYYFPGTQVASSDAQSFLRQPYPVDAIMCGDTLVWIDRELRQRQIRLEREPEPNSARHQGRGNRVHAGSASAEGEN
jgi:JAB domain-containing protein similar to deubiquitination enzymes